MARNYFDPRSKKHRWHDEDKIKHALSLISKGNSIRSVAKDTNIPYSVLQRYNKKNNNSNFEVRKIGGQTVLSKETELCLVNNILKCSEWG